MEELRAARDAAEEQSISLALANGELSRLLDFRSGLLAMVLRVDSVPES